MKKNLLAALFPLITISLYCQVATQNIKTVNIFNNDLIYVSSEDKIYVTTPSVGPNGNSLCVINPYTGNIEECFFIGSEPNKLAISDDDQYLYIGLNGAPEVVQFDLNTKEITLTFGLGSDPFFDQYFVEDMEVLPNQPNTIVVSRRNQGFSPKHEGVAVYDSGVIRPNTSQGHTGSNTIAFDEVSGGLFGYNNESTEFGFRVLTINTNGVTQGPVTSGLISGFGDVIESQDNFIYSSKGEVVEIINGVPTLAGIYSLPSSNYRAAVEPAPDTSLVYFVTDDFLDNFNLDIFDKNTFNHLETRSFSNILGDLKSLINWGNEGKLAFNTEQAVVILRSCVSQFTDPLVLFPTQVVGCMGESIELSAPDSLPNYFWSTGETTQTITVNEEGAYFFSVADSLGCSSPPSNTVTVEFNSQPPSPFIYGSSIIELCQGESTTLNASSTPSIVSYIWSTGETTQSIEVTINGVYSVVGVSQNGCISNVSNSIEVTVSNDTIPNQPAIAVDGPSEFCQGESTILSAPEGFDFYEWSNGQNTQSIEIFNTGFYSVQVANIFSCFSNPSPGVSISVNPTPSTPFIQVNGNILASSSAQGNQWFLNGVSIPNATGQFYAAIEDGFYSVQVTLNGCISPMSEILSHTVVSLDELQFEKEVIIFPNPARHTINVQYKENSNEIISRIEIYNQFGQRIFYTYQTNQIDIQSYTSGLYLIKVYDVNNIIIKTDLFLKI